MDLLTKYLNSIAYKFPKGYPDMNNDQDVLLLESLLSGMLGENFKISETPLTPKELSKQNSSNNKERIDILIQKIKSNSPLTLDKGDETFTVYDPDGSKVSELENWDISKKAVTLEDKDGNIITTSKLKKTTDFGGGKGSGGGAAQTDQQESAQSLVNALAQKLNGNISVEDLTPENLKSVSNKVDITSPISDTIEFITTSPNWSDTLIHTAKLVNKFIGQDVEFHRGSPFVDNIYSSWNKARKGGELGGIKNDKWNPSDIWAVSPDVKSMDFKTDLVGLNNQLIDLFDERKLVGISLKKLGPNSGLSVKAKEPQSGKEEYVGATISPTSKDAYINFTSGAKMQLRTFSNDGTSFQGELKGKTANQGKIGGGILASILQRNGLNPIPSQKETRSLVKSLSDEFIKEFIELAKNYGKFEITTEELKSKSFDWLSSKYQALSVIKSLEDGSKENVGDALTDILNYAGSTSSISSVHLKVS